MIIAHILMFVVRKLKIPMLRIWAYFTQTHNYATLTPKFQCLQQLAAFRTILPLQYLTFVMNEFIY